MKPNPKIAIDLVVLLALCHAPFAYAHSGPPVSVVVSLLWGGLAYVIASVLLISAKYGKRLKYFMLMLVGYPVWWAVHIFSVAFLVEAQPWDMIWAVLLPCLLIAVVIRTRSNSVKVHPEVEAQRS
jgi:hypothetical protein